MNKVLYIVIGVLLTVGIYLWIDICQFKLTIDKGNKRIQTYSDLFDMYKRDSLNVHESNERLKEEANSIRNKLFSRSFNRANGKFLSNQPIPLVCLTPPMNELIVEFINKSKHTPMDSLSDFIKVEILNGYSNADGLVYKLVVSYPNASEMIAMHPMMLCSPIEGKQIILVVKTLDEIVSVNSDGLLDYYKTYFLEELNEMSNVQKKVSFTTPYPLMEVLYNAGLWRVENKKYSNDDFPAQIL